MLYIHKLQDLNPKSADIECFQLVREIKRRLMIPVNEARLREEFLINFVSNTDLGMIEKSLTLIPETITEIGQLFNGNDYYEVLNLQRACMGLKEVSEPLKNSLAYCKSIFEWQEIAIVEMMLLLNMMRSLNGLEEKKQFDLRVNNIFGKLLRNTDSFVYNYNGIIHEGEVSRVNSIMDMISQGTFFHVELEEHIKKLDFSIIKQRIPLEELNKVDAIKLKLYSIKAGIDRAYQTNLHMVNWALTFYAYISAIKSMQIR